MPIEESSGRIGGWSEYDPSEAVRTVPLADTETTSGRTEAYMERVELGGEGEGGEGASTGTAFVTHYNDGFRPDVEDGAPLKRYAQNQMATYAFADAVGAKVPRNTYSADEEWVASEGVDGYAINDIAYSPLDREMGDAARAVDREQFIDTNAVQLIAGNRDLHGGNLFVEDNGTVQAIDLDLAGYEYEDMEEFERSSRKAVKTSETLASRRGEGNESDEAFEVSREEISGRAQEIAVALDENGQVDRVVEAVAAYDEFFAEKRQSNHTAIRNNIEMLIRAARGGESEDSSEGQTDDRGEGGDASMTSDPPSQSERGSETGGLGDLFETGGGLDDLFGAEEERGEGETDES